MTARGMIATIGATTERPMTVTTTNTAEGGGTRTIVHGAGALPGTTMEEEEEAGREEGKLFVRIVWCMCMWHVHECRCMYSRDG